MQKNKIIKTVKRFIKNFRKLPYKFRRLVLILILVVILGIIIAVSSIINNSKQKAIEYNGNNLSEKSYPGYNELIEKLKSNHPNWHFTLYYTRLNWDTVTSNEGHITERTQPLNLVPNTSKYENWKCEKDPDKTYDNGTWVCASDKAIKYRMDPRNLLNEDLIFQLKNLTYTKNANTIEGIQSKTKDSFLEGEDVAKSILEAGEKHNIDPYFIVSRLIQEQGKKGTKLSQGYKYNDQTVYNPFNMSASGNSQTSILNNAAKYAYEHEWFTIEKALEEGVELINTKYLNRKQDTLYFQKFDVIKPGELYSNQYMQNLNAPTSESTILLDQYETSNTINSEFDFIIPLYENMPKDISQKP